MTKVLFIHDGPRWKDSQGVQYGNSTDADMYNRYLYLGEKVEFSMRVFKADDTSNLINLNALGLYINPIVPFNRPFLLKNYFSSKKEIHRNVDSADILIARLPSTIGSVAVSYAKKINKPYIVEVVACPWDSLTNHSKLGRLYAPLSKLKLKRLLSDAKFAMYVTKEFLQNRYPSKYHSIGISDVILTNFPSTNTKESNYSGFEKAKKIVITTTGVVNIAYKGQQYVLFAMAKLREEGYNLYYNIVGGGDNKRLVDLVASLDLQNNVLFTGKLPHSEIFSLLDNTDLYIQPSETEGLPRALVEAMSRGCACIGSDAGGIPELLHKSAIFKSKDVSDLTAKIKNILTIDNLIANSKRNYEHAKDFTLEKLDAERREFYDKFLKSINEK